MVASAPSPSLEWEPPLHRWAARPTTASVRRPSTRVPRLLVDAVLALALAGVLRPSGTSADVALVATWVVLLASARRPSPLGATTGTGLVQPVLRAGIGLACLGLVLAAVVPALRPGDLLTFVVLVTSATLLHRTGASLVSRRAGATMPLVVVAGHEHGVARFLQDLRTSGSPVVVVGACVTGRPDGVAALGVPTMPGLRNLPDAVARYGADAVVAVPCRHVDPARLRRLAWRLEGSGTALYVTTGLQLVGPRRADLQTTGSLSVLHVRHPSLRGAGQVVKTTWERLAALLALVVLAPLLIALAVIVRLDSPGPALFRQTRVGRNGELFTMYKLRTMCTDAEDRLQALLADGPQDGVLFKLTRDPRVTRVGAVLRRYSLDELPQLINVARGDMALVGPRPPLPREVELYDRDTHRRLVVTPGLTGLWQVSGRSDLSWEESMRLDLQYVENWSLGLDLHILARTVRAVLRHQGAY